MIRSIRAPHLLILAAIQLLPSPATLAAPQHSPEPEEVAREHEGHGDARHDSGYEHHTAGHDFADAEQWSARFDSPEREAWQKPAEVAALLEIKPGMTVADLGTGTGYFLSYLSRATGENGRVLALDPEADMIRFVGERAEREGLLNVEPRKIPFDDPELAPESVDRVLIVNTWHHIAERAVYAHKLLAALEPGGRVMIVDFTRDSPSGPPVEERLDPQQVIDELASGGLEAGLIEETLPRQYVVVGRRP